MATDRPHRRQRGPQPHSDTQSHISLSVILVVRVIVSFHDRETREIYDGVSTKRSRKRLPQASWRVAQRKLDQLHAATRLQDLRAPPANRLEALVHDREGRYAIRINDQYRVCFVWSDAGPSDVEFTDYH